MERGHAVGLAAEAQRQDREAEERGAAHGVLAGDREELVAADAHLRPEAAEVLLHEREGEGVVAGGHGRVGGEDGVGGDRLEGLVEVQAVVLDHLADALEAQEGRVALVHVPGGRLDAEGAERAHAADAEDDLLGDAHVVVAAVELRAEAAVFGGVAVDVGVQEVDRDAADLDAPDLGEDGAAGQLDVDDDLVAVGRGGRLDRQLGEVELVVLGLLHAVGAQLLTEVALVVEQAHRHEGDVQVARGLAVVAGQDAQAARVDGQGLMQAELGREVGHGLVGLVRVGLLEPGHFLVHVGVEALHDGVVVGQEALVGSGGVEAGLIDLAQELHGVVVDGLPQVLVQAGEQRLSLRVPAPPHVVGQLPQAFHAIGEDGEDGDAA
ncbi:hypothetical protein D3C72_1008770 [compost metagenome]